jgi:NAD(P)-dependent dehydrogenase (short-subunit alcohol dehydrogenase family)
LPTTTLVVTFDAMAKTILVCGFGPGISAAVADKFAAEGFSVALVARNKDRLQAGVKALEAKGAKAAAFSRDLSDPRAAGALVGEVKEKLGPVSVVHWNAYGGDAGDLLASEAAEVRKALDIAVVSPLALIRAALADLQQDAESALLFTNGGLWINDPKVDAAGVQWGAMGLSLANAAKHKMVGLLAAKLKDSVYVGEVVVSGIVKGSAFDQGNGTIESKTIADRFWSMYKERRVLSTQV